MNGDIDAYHDPMDMLHDATQYRSIRWFLQCAVQRRGSSVGEISTRQLVAPAGSNRSGERRQRLSL